MMVLLLYRPGRFRKTCQGKWKFELPEHSNGIQTLADDLIVAAGRVEAQMDKLRKNPEVTEELLE